MNEFTERKCILHVNTLCFEQNTGIVSKRKHT